tara:strand:- start:1023 stop:1490 length:468 start_codon:yes stop_codon:yes gene_type:complete
MVRGDRLLKSENDLSYHNLTLSSFLKIASEDEFSETEEDYLEYEVESGPKLSEADERALAMFMSKNAPERQTLADVLKKKMDEQDGASTIVIVSYVVVAHLIVTLPPGFTILVCPHIDFNHSVWFEIFVYLSIDVAFINFFHRCRWEQHVRFEFG